MCKNANQSRTIHCKDDLVRSVNTIAADDNCPGLITGEKRRISMEYTANNPRTEDKLAKSIAEIVFSESNILCEEGRGE